VRRQAIIGRNIIVRTRPAHSSQWLGIDRGRKASAARLRLSEHNLRQIYLALVFSTSILCRHSWERDVK
jgi:hypothetical protein